jgi:hypothetical protein
LRQRHGIEHRIEHRFPLTRSLRASVQRSTSVSFSFVRSFDCGGIIHHPAIKNDSSAIPEPTEWERIRNQINAAMIFAVGLRKRGVSWSSRPASGSLHRRIRRWFHSSPSK